MTGCARGDSSRRVHAPEPPLIRKSRRGEVVLTTRPVAFLGYRVSRAGIRPGKRMMKRMKQRFRALRHESPERVARSIESYRGWIGFG